MPGIIAPIEISHLPFNIHKKQSFENQNITNIEIQTDETLENESTMKQSETVVFNVPKLPEQVQINSKLHPQPLLYRRQSIRLVEKNERRIFEETIKHQTIIDQPKHNKTLKRAKKPSRISVIAEYFEENTQTQSNPTAKASKSDTKNLKSKHKDGVLRLLNTGTIKEVQILPRVGLKTAYQIVTHRILNGPYKSFEQLAKLQFWRGNEYKRFVETNNLD